MGIGPDDIDIVGSHHLAWEFLQFFDASYLTASIA
jgi:hypothetical protein